MFSRILTSRCGVPLNHLLMVSHMTINVSTLFPKMWLHSNYDQLHVKALLSLKQITANHTLYSWPCLKCCFASHLSFIALLSLPVCVPLPSLRTDKIIFQTHLTDTDLIRGNQSPTGEAMNDMEIMQKMLNIPPSLKTPSKFTMWGGAVPNQFFS